MTLLKKHDWCAQMRKFWDQRTSVFLHADGLNALNPATVPLGLVGFQTSGSSGRPQWIALTKESILTSAAAVNTHLGVKNRSCWGLALPFHHVGGFGVLARSWQANCRIAMIDGRWNATSFAKWLAQERVTHVALVPTQVHDLVTSKISAPSGLMAVVVGGGKLNASLAAEARSLDWPILASYGMTEAASQIATQALLDGNPLGNGEVLPILPHWQTRVTDGQLLEISGPSLFAGVLDWNDDAWDWRPRESDWFRTQDRVILYPEGLLPLGRADNRIKVLGELVDPAEVEWELLVHAKHAVSPRELAVMGVPDARSGKSLVLIVTQSVADTVLQTMLEHYNAQSPGFRRILQVRRVAELPLSPLGKLRRGDLEFLLKEIQ